jgi:hypothetical protein
MFKYDGYHLWTRILFNNFGCNGCVENADCGLRGGSHTRKLIGTIVFYKFVTHYFEFLSSTTLEVKVKVEAKVRAKAKVKYNVKDKVTVKLKSL